MGKKKKEPEPAACGWSSARISTGETLGTAAARRKVLLVFLRHSG